MNILDGFSDTQLKLELERRRHDRTRPAVDEDVNLSPVLDYVEELVQSVHVDGKASKDFEHYLFEIVMECVYGKDVWDWWNVNFER